MITALNFTDFLYRPRRPEELDTAQGGGVVFSQGAHQVDIVRLLAGGQAQLAFARRRALGSRRGRPKARTRRCSTFDDGAFASLTYSGYAHFDATSCAAGSASSGTAEGPGDATARRARRLAASLTPAEEARAEGRAQLWRRRAGVLRRRRRSHHHFGMVHRVVRARGSAAAAERRDDLCRRRGAGSIALPPPAVPRAEVIDELYDAVAHGRRPRSTRALGDGDARSLPRRCSPRPATARGHASASSDRRPCRAGAIRPRVRSADSRPRMAEPSEEHCHADRRKKTSCSAASKATRRWGS